MFSTIVLTHNEEANIEACLQSLSWCDDLHVVDSGSTDKTVKLAKKAGVSVLINSPYPSCARQRNWALKNCDLKYDWVLFLDADERSTDFFRDQALAAISNAPKGIAGYYCCWKLFLEGVWLKHCDRFPNWQMRLIHKKRVTFADGGHAQKPGNIKGYLGYIEEPYLHYAFNKGWSFWWERHNRYATLEADFRMGIEINENTLFSKDIVERSKARRALFSKIPFSCSLFFLYIYLLRLGFMEGAPGFFFCVNRAYYEFMIKLKIREKQRNVPL